MAVVTAVVAFDERVQAHTTAERLAQQARMHPSLEVEPLLADPNVAAYALLPGPSKTRGRMRVSRPDAHTVLVGGPGRVHAEGEVVARELTSPGTATQDIPFGRWLALRHDPATGTLRVLNDPLGQAWLYVASIPGGVLLSSDLAALAEAYPDTLTVDEGAVLTQLALSFVPSDATCLNEITMLPPGSVVEFTAAGRQVLSRYRPPYGDQHSGDSRDAKFEMIDTLLAGALERWCDGDYSDVVVSLSGGHDSPFALAGLLALGVSPRCLTWGNPRSRDARVPRELAESLGFPWTLIEAPRASWPSWLRAMQSVGALGTDWAGWADDWLDQLAGASTGVITGSAGEALTGKNIRPPDEGIEGDWIAKWQSRAYQEDRWNGSRLLRPEARRRLPDAVRQHADARLDGVDTAFPFQRSLHLDLYGRQRRLTGGQTNQMARALAPLPFFQTREMLDFWLNLPWSDFGGQQLYLDYATSRHGHVFNVVLAAREADLFGARKAPQRLTRAVRLRLAGRFPGLRQRLATTSNDLLGNQLRFYAEISALLARVEPLLEPVIDVAALRAEIGRFPRTRPLSPFRLMNLLGVAAHLDLATGRATQVAPSEGNAVGPP